MERKQVKNYLLMNELGRGNFGSVYRAVNITNHQEVAIKTISHRSLSPKLEEMLCSEIGIMKKLKCPNTVALLDTHQDESYFYLLMEYCKGPNLEMHLRRKNRPMTEEEVRRWANQLVNGLAVMSENRIIHRDLKLANVMLSEENEQIAELKICDFGFARYLEENSLAESMIGTPITTAPEVLNGEGYDEKVDIWGLGAILFEMLVGRKPFVARSLPELKEKQLQGISFENTNLSPCAKALLLDLLQYDPRNRLSIAQVKQHPFFLSIPEPELDIDKADCDMGPYNRMNNVDCIEAVALKYEHKDKDVYRRLLEICLNQLERKRKRTVATTKTEVRSEQQMEYFQMVMRRYEKRAEDIDFRLQIFHNETALAPDSLFFLRKAEDLIVDVLRFHQKVDKAELLEAAEVMLAVSDLEDQRVKKNIEICQWLSQQ